MDAVSEIIGRAVPLDRRDVDTDQIIPSDWLKRVERTGFGEGLFSEWRESSDFVLNRAEYQGDDVRVLVAGANFGCGSSREQAPLALKHAGVAAVIADSFARIYFRNSINNGLPALVCDTSAIEDGDDLELDLEKGVVTNLSRGQEIGCDPMPKVMLDILKEGGLVEYMKNHRAFSLEGKR